MVKVFYILSEGLYSGSRKGMISYSYMDFFISEFAERFLSHKTIFNGI